MLIGARYTADILRKAAPAGPDSSAVPASRSLATSVRIGIERGAESEWNRSVVPVSG